MDPARRRATFSIADGASRRRKFQNKCERSSPQPRSNLQWQTRLVFHSAWFFEKPMHSLRILIVPFLLLAAVPSAWARPLAEFQEIVVADDAGGVALTAAEELSHYVGRITGKAPPIVPWSKRRQPPTGACFYVGPGAAEQILDTPPAPWREEEYLLKTVPTGLILAGSDEAGDPWSVAVSAGTMLAVYTLLDDHLGCRWFWPGPTGEHVPGRNDAAVPTLEVRAVPKLAIRSVTPGYTSYHTPAFRDASRKWTRRARLAWAKSAVFGHSWFDAFNLRTTESFKKHPEWFALVKGERRGPQMCTTNPAVIDRMVEFVLQGKPDIVNISPSDGGGFCECERCRALDVPGVLAYDNKSPQLSDRIFTYANEIARRVREKNPNKSVGIIAYTFYNRPPLRIGKLEPNVYISFVYQAAAHRDPKNLAEWRSLVDGWKKLGAKLVIREGWGNHYYHDLPFLHDRLIVENFAEAYQRGFVAAYGEGSKNFATMAPNYWALQRMMWDPTRDPAAVMPEFYRDAYGPAAEPMRAFFETYAGSLDAHWAERDRHVNTTGIAYANVINAWRRFLPESTVDEAEAHLAKAERLAPPGEYADRVALHRLGQDYTRLMLELLDTYKKLGELGVPLDTFASLARLSNTTRDDPAERDALLKRAYDLGEKREAMLLANRDRPGPDEGLCAFTVDADIRRWHKQVKIELKIDAPSKLTKAALTGVATKPPAKKP
jgi:hypothetical protein